MVVRIAAVAALFLVSIPLHNVSAAEAAATLLMHAEGEVQIATDGKVSDYRLTSPLSPGVAALVDKGVRSWTFEPIVVDGAPVVAKTAMHLSLKAEPTDVKDQYRIRITDIRFGDLSRGANFKMRPPHYPMEAVRAHLGARVLLAVRVDDEGKVSDIEAYQTSLDARARSENDAERWRRMFESASIEAARSWHYDVSETINGKRVGSKAIIPVEFSVSDVGAPAQKPGVWKAYVPGPLHPVPWMGDHVADNRDLSTLAEDRGFSLDSQFRLKDSVVGKTL